MLCLHRGSAGSRPRPRHRAQDSREDYQAAARPPYRAAPNVEPCSDASCSRPCCHVDPAGLDHTARPHGTQHRGAGNIPRRSPVHTSHMMHVVHLTYQCRRYRHREHRGRRLVAHRCSRCDRYPPRQLNYLVIFLAYPSFSLLTSANGRPWCFFFGCVVLLSVLGDYVVAG
jgi:hypothetical protein